MSEIKRLAYVCNKCHTYDKVNVIFDFQNTETPEDIFVNENYINYICPI